MSYTLAQQWAISGSAAVLGVVALILASIVFVQQEELNGNATIVSSIATQNGFAGTIDNTGTGTLQVTTIGFLSGGSNGELESAIPQQITGVRLADYRTSPFAGNNIVPADSILDGLEKCLLLKQTRLIGFTPSSIVPMNASDTTFTAMQKASRAQVAYSPYVFSCDTELSITNSLSFAPIINASNLQGSLTLAPNVLQPGSTLVIRILGRAVIVNNTPVSGAQFGFYWNETLVNTLALSSFPFNSTWTYLYQMNVTVRHTGIVLDLFSTFSSSLSNTILADFGWSQRSSTAVDLTISNSFLVKAIVGQTGVPPNNVLFATFSVGTYACNFPTF